MNLSDISESKYLASADYQVGDTLGPATITKVDREQVPVPNKRETKEKLIIYADGFAKPYAVNNTVKRTIGALLGAHNIDKTWIGATLTIKVVDNVRRPDGSVGNAFRLDSVHKPKAVAQVSPLMQEARDLYGKYKAIDAEKADEMKARHGKNYAAMVAELKTVLA